MFQFHLSAFMNQKGIASKHRIARIERLGINYYRAKKLLSGNIKYLRLDELEKICLHLNCTPYELIKYEAKSELDSSHSLLAWQPSHVGISGAELLQQLNPEKLKEAEEYIRKLAE